MDSLVYKINLDCLRKDSQAIVNAKVGETNGRKIVFTLYEGRSAFFVPEGATAIFRAKKPSGAVLYNSCDINDGKVEYTLTQQTVAEQGVFPCEIQIIGADKKIIYTPCITLDVAQNLYSDAEVESTSEFTALTGAIDEVRASKAFTIKLTTTSDGITADKTFTEIAEKVNAAKSVVINMDGWVFPVSYSADSGKIVFSSLWANIAEIPNTVTFAVNSSNAWNVVVSDIPTTAQVSAKYTKPASGIPKADLASDVQASLGKAETALQEHQSLAAYRTAAEQNIIDNSKQDRLIAGENITIAEDGKTISAKGGSSVPKPLTYDYMPEGYPSKSVQTTVLLEEQEVAFSEVEQDVGGVYAGFLTHPFSLVLGQTYTVNWDGTEYECVASRFQGARADLIGNPSVLGEGEDTGEPFLYGDGMFATLDTSPSHTISVKTSTGTITPMSAEFIPTMNVTAFTNDAGYLTLATLPKPLTYDYMPEGYPKKEQSETVIVENQTISGFQENTSLGVYIASNSVMQETILNKYPENIPTIKILWDGTEYECQYIHAAAPVNLAYGNTSLLGVGEDTGEPFLIPIGEPLVISKTAGDSHEIKVSAVTENITPMAEEFLPPMNVSAFTNDSGYLTLATLPKYEGVVE